jgi:hypothetical protein
LAANAAVYCPRFAQKWGTGRGRQFSNLLGNENPLPGAVLPGSKDSARHPLLLTPTTRMLEWLGREGRAEVLEVNPAPHPTLALKHIFNPRFGVRIKGWRM